MLDFSVESGGQRFEYNFQSVAVGGDVFAGGTEDYTLSVVKKQALTSQYLTVSSNVWREVHHPFSYIRRSHMYITLLSIYSDIKYNYTFPRD